MTRNIKSKPIYLDHAAATPLDDQVYAAMKPYLEIEFANPSSIYGAARITRHAIEAARSTIADTLGAKTSEIIFTSGGTESDNLAIQGVLNAHPGAHWATSAIEHDAVLSCVEPMSLRGHESSIIAVAENGIVRVKDIADAITDSTVLVSLMMANNEIGTLQPVDEIANLIQGIREDRMSRNIDLPLYLHTDACQAAGYLDIHVSRTGVDLMTLNGSKIYGPKGVGLLYIRHGTVVEPLIYGGGQERGRRSGTENVAGIVGLAEALKQVVGRRNHESHRLKQLRDSLDESLQLCIPGIELNGDANRRLVNNLNYTIPGADGEALVLYLDKIGIMASTGSACSSGDLESSHVLLAIGRSEAEASQSLRFTFGRSTDEPSIDLLAEKLPGIIARVRDLT
jgi:cysteine desulfurase